MRSAASARTSSQSRCRRSSSAVCSARIAGILYVLPSSVVPDSHRPHTDLLLLDRVLLGGAATVFGPVLGSMLLYAIVVRILATGVR